MKTTTPFAQLGSMQKSGSDLFSTGNTWGDLGVELAAGSNPFTGVPFYGARMLHDAGQGWGKLFKGDIRGALGSAGSAMGNALWGGLSAFGVGGAGAALKGGVGALKALPAVGRLAQVAKGTGAAATAARGAMAAGKAVQTAGSFAGRQLGNLSNVVANTRIPLAGGRTLGQGAGHAAADVVKHTGLSTVIPANATGAAATAAAPGTAATAAAPATAAPMAQAAPSWYSAVTGNTAVPQFQ